jgi:flagellar biosynthesis/type III secretory pathway protein FliH
VEELETGQEGLGYTSVVIHSACLAYGRSTREEGKRLGEKKRGEREEGKEERREGRNERKRGRKERGRKEGRKKGRERGGEEERKEDRLDWTLLPFTELTIIPSPKHMNSPLQSA